MGISYLPPGCVGVSRTTEFIFTESAIILQNQSLIGTTGCAERLQSVPAHAECGKIGGETGQRSVIQ